VLIQVHETVRNSSFFYGALVHKSLQLEPLLNQTNPFQNFPPSLILRFVAFPETEYGEVLSGYQPGQMVER